MKELFDFLMLALAIVLLGYEVARKKAYMVLFAWLSFDGFMHPYMDVMYSDYC